MNQDRIVKNFMELVSIDSPSFKEGAMAQIMVRKLEQLGFQVTIDQSNQVYGSQTGNIYGFLKGSLPGGPVLFSAHLDTVEPSASKTAVLNPDGTITSAGNTVLGADDLAGIAEILEAVEAIQEEGIPHLDIEVLFPFAEESFLKGSAVADYSYIRSQRAYVLDLEGEIGTCAIKAASVAAFRASIEGKAAHAGFSPEAGIHSIKAMAEVIEATPTGLLDQDTRLNIGTIHGGLGKNVVPPLCEIEGEVRSMDHRKVLDQLAALEERLKNTSTKYGTTYTFEYDIPCLAYEVDVQGKTMASYQRACEKAGIEPVYIETYGGSDNNNYMKNGISGIVIACGMHQVHSTKEYTRVQELLQTSRLVYYLMTETDI